MKKTSKITSNNNFLLSLLLEIMMGIVRLERHFIKKNGLHNLIFSRSFSFLAIITVSFVITGLFLLIAAFFKSLNNGYNYEYWWTILLLFCLPLSIKILINFKNSDYLLGEKILDFLVVINIAIPSLYSFKSYWEFLSFIMFTFLFTTLQLYALTNFIELSKMHKFLENKFSIVIFIVISIATYITVRIFGMVENTLEDRFNKSKRLFLLWLSGTIITIIYISYTFLTLKDNVIIHLPYQVITLLLAIEKTKDSYKKLTENINVLLHKEI